jgi:hypothetical protein
VPEQLLATWAAGFPASPAWGSVHNPAGRGHDIKRAWLTRQAPAPGWALGCCMPALGRGMGASLLGARRFFDIVWRYLSRTVSITPNGLCWGVSTPCERSPSTDIGRLAPALEETANRQAPGTIRERL